MHAGPGAAHGTGGASGPTGDGGTVNLALTTLADVLALLARAVNDCLALENSLSAGRGRWAICAGVWGDVLRSLSELERRVAALEALGSGTT